MERCWEMEGVCVHSPCPLAHPCSGSAPLSLGGEKYFASIPDPLLAWIFPSYNCCPVSSPIAGAKAPAQQLIRGHKGTQGKCSSSIQNQCPNLLWVEV